MKKKSKAAFLANLKAMPDCDEKEKLLKSLEGEPEEDDDAREALAQVKPGAKKAPAKKARETTPVVPLRRRTKKAA